MRGAPHHLASLQRACLFSVCSRDATVGVRLFADRISTVCTKPLRQAVTPTAGPAAAGEPRTPYAALWVLDKLGCSWEKFVEMVRVSAENQRAHTALHGDEKADNAVTEAM